MLSRSFSRKAARRKTKFSRICRQSCSKLVSS